jgi:hypothetical protein
VLDPDFTLSQRTVVRGYVNRSSRGVDLDGDLGRAGDRQMAPRAKQRFDLDYGAPHVDAVEESASSRDSDGREYAHDAERDGKLDQGERVSHRSFRGIAWLNSIRASRVPAPSGFIRMYSFRSDDI